MEALENSKYLVGRLVFVGRICRQKLSAASWVAADGGKQKI